MPRLELWRARQLEAGRRGKPCLKRHPELKTSERSPDALVDTVAEGEMWVWPAIGTDGLCVPENPPVAVTRSEVEEDSIAPPEMPSVKLEIAGSGPWHRQNWSLVP